MSADRTPSGAGGPGRGERRRRLEEERRLRAETETVPAVPLADPVRADEVEPLTKEPVTVVEHGTRSQARVIEMGDRTTSTLPAVRPPQRPPTPEEAHALADARPEAAPAPSFHDTLTGRVPVVREPLAVPEAPEVAGAPRHHAPGAGTGDLPAARDRTLTVLLAVVLAVALSAAAGLVWVLQSRGDDATTAAPATGAPAAAAAQRTVLTILDDGATALVSAAVLGVDGTRATSVLIPSGLQVDGLSSGRVLMAQTLGISATAPAEAVSEALRVRVDGTWRLTPAGLASLVDAVGGVVVDVDREVVAGDVLLAPGAGQRLSGAQAAAYASSLSPGEPEEARLARYHAVLSATIAALPEGPAAVQALLAQVGGASSATFPASALSDVLDRARQRAQAGGIAGTVLPVTPGTAADEKAYELDADAARDVVSAQLGGAVLPEPTGGSVEVLVRNGVGTPGLNDAARQRLMASGLRFVSGGNADSFDVITSRVLVASASAQDRQSAERVADALGLDRSTVAVDELGTSLADVVVVLGADFAADVTDRGVLPSP